MQRILTFALLIGMAFMLLGARGCGDDVNEEPGAECTSDDDCNNGQVCNDRTCVDDNSCVCADIYAPVCGADGETYGNDCEARCAGVEIASEGECATMCEPVLCDLFCEFGFQTNADGCEMCACNDAPPQGCYSDADCEAGEACQRADDGCLGPPCNEEDDPNCGCPGECVPNTCACPAVWMPVCGVDGETYGNACEADCAGVEVEHRGECGDGECQTNEDCSDEEICYPGTQECQPACDVSCFRYDPVCGTDGVTYGCGQADAWCNGVEVEYDGECRNECPDLSNYCTLSCNGEPTPEIPPGCPVPDCICDECPDISNYCELACSGQETPEIPDGCAIPSCLCPEPGCYLDEDCNAGEMCERPEGCLGPPCTEEEPDRCGCPGVCIPRESECLEDSQCRDGERCEVEEYCPACVNEEPPCAAPCTLSGSCVPDEPCECPENYDPVCGEDGNTYSNSCFARCEGAEIAYDGECRDECPDTSNYCELVCSGQEPPEIPDGCPIPGCRCPEPGCYLDSDCNADEMCERPEGCLGPPCNEDDPDRCGCPGVCIPRESECLEDSQCRDGQRCEVEEYCPACVNEEPACEAPCTLSGTCVSDPEECNSHNDCPEGLVCERDDRCLGPPCDENDPDCEGCPGICVEPDMCEPVLCDLFCEFGFRTDENGCEVCECNELPQCRADADCAEGQEWCEDGTCVECDNSGLFCDLACPEGHVMPERNGCFPCDCVPQECDCPDVWDPVCADGQTYGNSCEARCAGATPVTNGACEGQCRANEDCPDDEICYPGNHTCQSSCTVACIVEDLVCGTDGVTYVCGQAEAWCNGVEVAFDGSCQNECVCPDVWEPVCGADGETYGNSCEARCAGATPITNGVCECPDVEGFCEAVCSNQAPPFIPDGCPTPDCLCDEGCQSNDDCGRGQTCEIPPGCDGGPQGCSGECVPDDGGFACGNDLACVTNNEYCQIVYPGVQGAPTQYTCIDVPDECANTPNCDCIANPEDNGFALDCSDIDDGQVEVRIFAP